MGSRSICIECNKIIHNLLLMFLIHRIKIQHCWRYWGFTCKSRVNFIKLISIFIHFNHFHLHSDIPFGSFLFLDIISNFISYFSFIYSKGPKTKNLCIIVTFSYTICEKIKKKISFYFFDFFLKKRGPKKKKKKKKKS